VCKKLGEVTSETAVILRDSPTALVETKPYDNFSFINKNCQGYGCTKHTLEVLSRNRIPLRKQNTIFRKQEVSKSTKRKKERRKSETIFNKKAIFGVFFAVVAIATISTSVALAYSWDPADGLRIDGSTTVFPIVKAALGATAEGATSTAGPFQSVHAVQARFTRAVPASAGLMPQLK